MGQFIKTEGFILKDKPRSIVTKIPGRWLLAHTTPSWRIQNPIAGFQRVVDEKRARQIATSVIDAGRVFPNAIVLATDVKDLVYEGKEFRFDDSSKFMVIDGQHRLWAQNFASLEIEFTCLIHLGLDEVEMAKLFLEINDTQKKVSSSLRWDLLRLVKPEEDLPAINAADLVFALATEEGSPLFQRIDLTGEQKEIQLKQGSLAPELKRLISQRKFAFGKMSFDQQFSVLSQYFDAIKSLSPDDWGIKGTRIYDTRVIRALIRLLPNLLNDMEIGHLEFITKNFRSYLSKIDLSSLGPEKIKSMQGNAGFDALLQILSDQTLKK